MSELNVDKIREALNETTIVTQCNHGKENCRACGPEMDVLQRIELAMQHVFDLCAKRKTFRMSIPVEYTDSDELLCRALRTAQLEIESNRARLDLLEEVKP